MNAMSIHQLLAFRPEQLHAMPLEALEAMWDSILPLYGNWSDDYPDHNDTYYWRNVTDVPYQPTYPVTDTGYTNVEETSTGSTAASLSQRSVDNQDVSSVGDTTLIRAATEPVRRTLNGDGRVTPPSRDRSPCCTADADPFQDQSQIHEILDAVPDSVTTENVDRYLSVLSFIPAADIASKFTSSAVSVYVITSYLLLPHADGSHVGTIRYDTVR